MSKPLRARPYGTDAILIETGDRPPATLSERLAGRAGIGEVVPGACTVLVEYDPRQWTIRELLEQAEQAEQAPHAAATHVDIEVRYDGADLEDVATRAGCSVGEVIRRHTAPTYWVAFCGFSPGFAYLTGLDPALQVPRLDAPRTAVPAGAVAIAGEYSAVYPRRSPGGWRVLGRTEAKLWDIDRTPPALLTPGSTVRFTTA